MGFFRVFDLKLLNFGKREKVPSETYDAEADYRERLQGLLNNAGNNSAPLADTSSRAQISPRILEPEVQEAIKKFNQLSFDKKNEILDLADSRMQDKLMVFMNNNAAIMSTTDAISSSFRKFAEDIEDIRNSSYKSEKIKELAENYEAIRKKCMTNVDNTIQAFGEFKGDSELDTGKSSYSLSDKAGYVINISNRFRQTLLSYSSLLDSKFIELNRTTDNNHKQELINEITKITNKVENEYDKYYADASDALNSFIPEVIQAKNQFYAMVSKYVKNGIPEDLNLENKECENTFIDTLLETLNYTGAKIFV